MKRNHKNHNHRAHRKQNAKEPRIKNILICENLCNPCLRQAGVAIILIPAYRSLRTRMGRQVYILIFDLSL